MKTDPTKKHKAHIILIYHRIKDLIKNHRIIEHNPIYIILYIIIRIIIKSLSQIKDFIISEHRSRI